MLGVSAAAAATMQPSLRIMLLAFGALSLRSDGRLQPFCVIDALLRRELVGGACCCYPRASRLSIKSKQAVLLLVIGQLP